MTRLFAIAAVAALSFSAAAYAAPDSEAPTMKVQYADLNLATPSGVATFYGRIQTASAMACQTVGDDRGLDGRNQNKACRDEMISKAVESARIPALTELATGHSAPRQVAEH